MGFNLKSLKVLVKSTWFEIAAFTVIDIVLFAVLIFVYKMSHRLTEMLAFFVFLLVVIINAYKHKFVSLNFNISKKGKIILFLRACSPYILQAILFTECAMLAAWILFNWSQRAIV